MQRWRIIGLFATLIIVISLPIYALKQKSRHATPVHEQTEKFAGSESCAKCHKNEYEEWQQSHHAKAMAVANDLT